jgi:hypothetical protein
MGLSFEPCGLKHLQSWTGRPFLLPKTVLCGSKYERQRLLPFQISRRELQKELDPITICLFSETRKGVPTNRAGTPDAGDLKGRRAFAKGYFSGNHRQIRS